MRLRGLTQMCTQSSRLLNKNELTGWILRLSLAERVITRLVALICESTRKIIEHVGAKFLVHRILHFHQSIKKRPDAEITRLGMCSHRI